MAVAHGLGAVANEDTQAIAWIGQEETGAGFLDAAVVIEPAFQVGTVQAERAAGLLQEGQGMGAGFLRMLEALQRLMFAEAEWRWFPAFRGWCGACRVAYRKAPRRAEFDGRQVGRRGLRVSLIGPQSLSRTMSTWGRPASRNSPLSTLKPSRS